MDKIQQAIIYNARVNEKEHKDLETKIKGVSDSVDNLEQTINNKLEEIELTPGEKGDKGDNGIDGKNGLNGKDGLNGTNGKDGLNGLDGKDGVDGIDGVNGKDGKDGSPDTGEEIVKKINSQNDKIDYSKIKNLPAPIVEVREIHTGGGVVGLETIKNNGTIISNSTKSLNFEELLVTRDSDNVTVSASNKENSLPATPENPETKFLNGNKEWVPISIGAGGYAGNLYFTTLDSDVTGYKQISYVAETSLTELSGSITNEEVLFRTYLYPYAIEATIIDAGPWIASFRTKVSKTTGVTQLKFEAFLYHADTTETTLFSAYSSEINNVDYEVIRNQVAEASFSCVATDRLGIRIYAKTTSPTAVVVYTTIGDGDASYFTTPLAIRHDQIRARDKANSHPASAIQMDTLIGTPTYTTQNDFNNSFGSAGRKTGGYISKATGSYVAVEAGTGFIKATDDDNTQLIPFNWSAPANILIPANSVRYIGVEYNSGSPRVVAHTTYDWDFDTSFPLGRVINDTINSAEEIYIANAPWWVTDGMTNTIQAIRSFGLVHRDETVGGFILSVPGTRNIAVTEGVLWIGFNDLSFDGLDTSVAGHVEGYWKHSTNGWQESELTQYSVTQWNDVTKTALQTIPTGKYCNVWIYGELTDSTISIALVYPQALYNTSAQAEATTAPSNLPAHIVEFGILLGRIIIKQGVDSPVAVQTVFTKSFTASVVTDHGNLAGLADDDHLQYAKRTENGLFHQFNTNYTSCYSEVTTSDGDGRPTLITYYETSAKLTTLYTKAITYTSGLPTTVVITDSINAKKITITNVYTGGAFTSSTSVIATV